VREINSFEKLVKGFLGVQMPGEDLKSGFWSKFGKMLFADFSRLLIKNIVYFGFRG
jgi:hypothetical protein